MQTTAITSMKSSEGFEGCFSVSSLAPIKGSRRRGRKPKFGGDECAGETRPVQSRRLRGAAQRPSFSTPGLNSLQESSEMPSRSSSSQSSWSTSSQQSTRVSTSNATYGLHRDDPGPHATFAFPAVNPSVSIYPGAELCSPWPLFLNSYSSVLGPMQTTEQDSSIGGSSWSNGSHAHIASAQLDPPSYISGPSGLALGAPVYPDTGQLPQNIPFSHSYAPASNQAVDLPLNNHDLGHFTHQSQPVQASGMLPGFYNTYSPVVYPMHDNHDPNTTL